jgi:regulator of replication initiation timing
MPIFYPYLNLLTWNAQLRIYYKSCGRDTAEKGRLFWKLSYLSAMISVEQYRARIGLFGPRKNLKNTQTAPFISVMFARILRFGHYFLLTIYACGLVSVLLVIGGVERNPGPPKSSKTIDDVLAKLERFETILSNISVIKESVTRIDSSISHLQQELSSLKDTCVKLEKEKLHLQLQLDKLEGHSRRSNLVFYNIEEDDKESWSQSERKVEEIIKLHLKLHLADGDIERAHRLGKRTGSSRPVIVKFNSYKKKKQFLELPVLLKGHV